MSSMSSTEIFLIVWIASIAVWEVMTLLVPGVETISMALSRLPTWAIVVIALGWAGLSVHLWLHKH